MDEKINKESQSQAEGYSLSFKLGNKSRTKVRVLADFVRWNFKFRNNKNLKCITPSSSNKKGQLAILVILAILLVASVIIFFVFAGDSIPGIVNPPGTDTVDPQSYFKECVRSNVLDVVEVMMPQGGFIHPGYSIIYNNTNVEYLCTNLGFYDRCTIQHPMLVREIETQIKNYITPNITDCMDNMKEYVEDRGGKVELSGPLEVGVDAVNDKVFVYINKSIKIERGNVPETFDGFQVGVMTPIYNFAIIANEITNAEAAECYFEPVGYSLNYPRYRIERYQMSHPTKIYTIKDLDTNKLMYIAIRSCAMPAGL